MYDSIKSNLAWRFILFVVVVVLLLLLLACISQPSEHWPTSDGRRGLTDCQVKIHNIESIAAHVSGVLARYFGFQVS